MSALSKTRFCATGRHHSPTPLIHRRIQGFAAPRESDATSRRSESRVVDAARQPTLQRFLPIPAASRRTSRRTTRRGTHEAAFRLTSHRSRDFKSGRQTIWNRRNCSRFQSLTFFQPRLRCTLSRRTPRHSWNRECRKIPIANRCVYFIIRPRVHLFFAEAS